MPSGGVGVDGRVYWPWNTQVAELVAPQVGPTCAVICRLLTGVPGVGVVASVIHRRASEMSKLPNGSLMVARTNTVAPG